MALSRMVLKPHMSMAGWRVHPLNTQTHQDAVMQQVELSIGLMKTFFSWIIEIKSAIKLLKSRL